MIPPKLTGFTVYTKTGCRYCELVKELLQHESPLLIDADPYLAADRDAFLAFITAQGGKGHKTFPMVFLNGVFVGGFTETYAMLNQV